MLLDAQLEVMAERGSLFICYDTDATEPTKADAADDPEGWRFLPKKEYHESG